MLNALGGFLYFLSGFLGFFDSASTIASVMTAAGIVFFLATSIMLLFMWRANDFGLILMRQLNEAMRKGHQLRVDRYGLRVSSTGETADEDGTSSRFSVRAVTF